MEPEMSMSEQLNIMQAVDRVKFSDSSLIFTDESH
jgi:hypothetical protein